MQRYFIDSKLKLNEVYQNLDKDAHHILNVMRMSLDDKFQVVDNTGNLFIAKIIEQNPFTYQVIEELETTTKSIKTTVICPLLKGEKFDFMIQKATELGADRFLIYEADHAVVKLEHKKKKNRLIRYQKIIQGASEQSKRLDVPSIEFVGKLENLNLNEYDLNLFAYENLNYGPSLTLIEALNTHSEFKNISIIFGPEGGFSTRETEIELITHVKLGQRILRAETAPLYVLSVIDALYGQLEN